MCKKCQQFKYINTLYGHLPPNIMAALKPWNLVHIDLIIPYAKSIWQHHPGGLIIKKDMSLTCMKIIDPTTGWFKIVKVPCFDLDELERWNSEYVDKYSARVIQVSNQKDLFRYPCPHKVMIYNNVNFKKYFTQFLKDSAITPICISIKNPQSNTLVERIKQVIYNMFSTKDIDSIVYDYLYPWEGNIALFTWVIIAYYHLTLGFTSGQAMFGRDMLFNLMSIVYWRILTTRNKRQVDIYNV